MSQSDFVNRGQALVASGQFQEAVKVCRLGLLGRPTTVEGRVVLGQALLALKRFDEVLAEMRIAIELDHGAAAPHALRGEALLRKGDHRAAREALQQARDLAPSDRQIAALLGEAEGGPRRPAPSGSHPAVGYVSESTRNYPNHHGDEDTGDSDSYTKPTSIASPASRDGKSRARAAVAAPAKLPGARELAVGDKSGTVEVDPELEEVDDDDDLGTLSPPPSAAGARAFEGPRGSIQTSGQTSGQTAGQKPGQKTQNAGGRNGARPAPAPASRESGQELDADDLIDVDEETPPPVDVGRGRAAVRSAVGMVSGPLDEYPVGAQSASLAQAIAGTPHVMQVTPVAAQPQVAHAGLAVPTAAPQARTMFPAAPAPAPMQAARTKPPTAPPPSAQPQPQPSPASYAAAAMKTVAIQPAPAAQPGMSGVMNAMGHMAQMSQPGVAQAGPAWAQSTVVAGGPHAVASVGPGGPGGPVDPALAALAALADGALPGQVGQAQEPAKAAAEPRAHKTGMRKTRSKLRVVLWVALGAAVIGGGVFAGFQIRAMRLAKQVDSARARATDLAKADTWGGWSAARDSLAGIVQAANTPENRAALARARAEVAFELGDGLPDAKQAVDALKGEGGLDAQLAAAYVALASDDPKGARTAADAALAAAPGDPAALYVAGRAQLLGGDANGALPHLKAAVAGDPRALYAVGLAQAYDAANAWDDALAAIDKALAASPENPAALVERAELSVRSGRIVPNNALGSEVRAQLDKLVAEGGQPLANQPRGVSAEQVALANVALAHVQLVRGDAAGALAAVKAALAQNLDDQRVVEGIIDAFYAQGDLARARTAAEKTLEHWPNSRMARIELAECLTAQGKPDEALAALAKSGEVTTLPLGLVARGDAKLALGDPDGARADFDAALKREPKLEPALVGRVTLDLAAGKVDEARKVIEPRFAGKDAVASVGTATAYAAMLRATGEPDRRERARLLLEKVTNGPLTPDVLRAKVELGRIYRDGGDLRAARDAFGAAASAGSVDARVESGLLQIEDRDPKGGYEILTQLVGALGDQPPPAVLLEAARASMLVGDHAGAAAKLDLADKARGVVRWQLDRERGRLALRRGDLAGAVQALARALDTCGPDPETFLLTADAVFTDIAAADEKTPARYPDLAKRLAQLSADRLVGRPEAQIITGILALANGKLEEASAAYKRASDQLDTDKATARRRARASYGLAILAYDAHNGPEAKSQLDIVLGQDPALYSAYLYRADVLAEKKDTKAALADARTAVTYDPELVDGWYLVGKLAHDLADKAQVDEAIRQISAIAPDNPHLHELQTLK